MFFHLKGAIHLSPWLKLFFPIRINEASQLSEHSVNLKSDNKWHDYKIDFLLEKSSNGFEFLLSDMTAIRSVKIYRNALPQKLSFENASQLSVKADMRLQLRLTEKWLLPAMVGRFRRKWVKLIMHHFR